MSKEAITDIEHAKQRQHICLGTKNNATTLHQEIIYNDNFQNKTILNYVTELGFSFPYWQTSSIVPPYFKAVNHVPEYHKFLRS